METVKLRQIVMRLGWLTHLDWLTQKGFGMPMATVIYWPKRLVIVKRSQMLMDWLK